MSRLLLTTLALLLAATGPVFAEQREPAQGCIDVQVGQARALAYGCLTEQLKGGTPQAAKGLRDQLDPARQLQRKAPNQMGLATPAATSTRMGNSFGTSAVPQRP